MPPALAPLPARAGGAKAALKVVAVLISLAHKMPAALAALGHGQHVVVNKLHQAPGARDAQQGLDTAGDHGVCSGKFRVTWSDKG